MKENRKNYTIQEINSIAKDMRYEALYWALGFEEIEKGIFTKEYNKNFIVQINADKGIVNFNNQIAIVNSDDIKLNLHKTFVILECIDKLLSMGYLSSEIIIDLDNEYDIYCKDLYIRCFEWNHMEEDNTLFNKDIFKSITYSSRLISGVIERSYSIKDYQGNIYNYGIFENESRLNKYELSKIEDIKNDDFVVKAGVITKYLGNDKKIIIPEGILELMSCLFWDNQIIEEVVLPDSLTNISGDTFYNCSNLKKVNIPANVKLMGNNPFAGCPLVEVKNESKYFNMINGVLYNKDLTRLIYYPIKKEDKKYKIHNGTKIIGKHSFYLCDNLEEVIIPDTVIKLENNPFSGCSKLDLINNSSNYKLINKVIYDKEISSVIGCLNSIDTNELLLENVKRICRNSFWNCKGIRKIVFPSTLKSIGYNPFVGCSNIEFVSNSKDYIVENGALFTKNKDVLICYPRKYAIGEVYLPDETITLERGAFSGASELTQIHLHNVSIISKTCFTNCNLLERVYCSDLVSYIGEWAFAHCENLKEVSIYKDCFVDNNVIINSKTNLIVRNERSNYVIESDNLPTLKSMIRSYKSKIKAILIDPPYNSHIDYIGYRDVFDGGYEKFMLDRIKLSYELLSDDGFLVVNIDEGEVKNISSICKSIFGKKVKIYRWEKLHPYFDTNRNVNPNKKKVKYEYIIICSKSNDSILKFIKQPYLENGILHEKEKKVSNILSCFGTNSSAKDEMEKIFGRRDYFATPKPLKLIKELVRATTNKNSLVLDFFAGSGTTGHAVINLNNEDGGNRKYILISNDESNICKDVTLKRMRIFNINVVFLE